MLEDHLLVAFALIVIVGLDASRRIQIGILSQTAMTVRGPSAARISVVSGCFVCIFGAYAHGKGKNMNRALQFCRRYTESLLGRLARAVPYMPFFLILHLYH